MSVETIVSESKSKMDKAVGVFQHELRGFRTGRALYCRRLLWDAHASETTGLHRHSASGFDCDQTL